MKTRAAEKERDVAKDAAIAAAGIGAFMSLAALGLYNGRAAISVAVGAFIAVANLVMLSALIRAILRPPEGLDPDPTVSEGDEGKGEGSREGGDAAAAPGATPDHAAEAKRGGAAWGAFALFKILFLFGGIWILLTRGLVDPIPLVVGYGVLPLGIVAAGLMASLRPSR
ncbi:MAG: hypothetical protein JST00_10655 [Deltaproteobacteria bacterium]|nr:hypothetical protein [Deltaproteobacteria bacterium]